LSAKVYIAGTTFKRVPASTNVEVFAVGSPRVRVLVVDDYEPWRRFIVATLQEQPELDVIAEASSGLEAVEEAQELRPDLILLDIGLPGLNGIDAARRIKAGANDARILFVSENRSREIVEEALRTGAGGYVIKGEANSDLLSGVRTVLAGGRFVSAALGNYYVLATGVTGAQAYVSSLLVFLAGIL
jgi:DNA-binding NarL/FixJ family response regulator